MINVFMDKDSLDKFQQFYIQYIDSVYNYIFYRVGRKRDRAEDLTSEIFLKAFKKFDTFDETKGKFQSWIFRIAHNHLVNHYRDSKKEVSIDEIGPIKDKKELFIEDLIRDEQKEVLMKVLDDLPTESRTIIHLRYFEGLSYDEISHIVGKKPSALRVKVHRLLDHLQRELDGKL